MHDNIIMLMRKHAYWLAKDSRDWAGVSIDLCVANMRADRRSNFTIYIYFIKILNEISFLYNPLNNENVICVAH